MCPVCCLAANCLLCPCHCFVTVVLLYVVSRVPLIIVGCSAYYILLYRACLVCVVVYYVLQYVVLAVCYYVVVLCGSIVDVVLLLCRVFTIFVAVLCFCLFLLFA